MDPIRKIYDAVKETIAPLDRNIWNEPLAYYHARLERLLEMLKQPYDGKHYGLFVLQMDGHGSWSDIDYRVPSNRDKYKDIQLMIGIMPRDSDLPIINDKTGLYEEGEYYFALIKEGCIPCGIFYAGECPSHIYATISLQNLLALQEGKGIKNPEVIHELYITSKKDVKDAMRFLLKEAYNTPLTTLRLVQSDEAEKDYVRLMYSKMQRDWLFKDSRWNGDYSSGVALEIYFPTLDEMLKDGSLVKYLKGSPDKMRLLLQMGVGAIGSIKCPLIAGYAMYDYAKELLLDKKKAFTVGAFMYAFTTSAAIGLYYGGTTEVIKQYNKDNIQISIGYDAPRKDLSLSEILENVRDASLRGITGSYKKKKEEYLHSNDLGIKELYIVMPVEGKLMKNIDIKGKCEIDITPKENKMFNQNEHITFENSNIKVSPECMIEKDKISKILRDLYSTELGEWIEELKEIGEQK